MLFNLPKIKTSIYATFPQSKNAIFHVFFFLTRFRKTFVWLSWSRRQLPPDKTKLTPKLLQMSDSNVCRMSTNELSPGSAGLETTDDRSSRPKDQNLFCEVSPKRMKAITPVWQKPITTLRTRRFGCRCPESRRHSFLLKRMFERWRDPMRRFLVKLMDYPCPKFLGNFNHLYLHGRYTQLCLFRLSIYNNSILNLKRRFFVENTW